MTATADALLLARLQFATNMSFLALSAASLSAVATTNTDRHAEAASPAGSECVQPWSFDQPPFGRCPDR